MEEVPEKFTEMTSGQVARILGVSSQRVNVLAKAGSFSFRINDFGWKIFMRVEIEEYAKKRALKKATRATFKGPLNEAT